MGRTSDAKTRILESAQALFYARSSENVGVQEICTHAGVQKGSFYHYFSSKTELILAVAARYNSATCEHLAKTVFSQNRPALKKIDHLFEVVYLFHKKAKLETGKVQGCFNINLSAELSTQDPDIHQKLAQHLSDSIVPIEAVLKQALEDGSLSTTVDTHNSAEAIFAYLQGLVVMAKAQNDPDVIRRLSKGVRALIK